MCGFCHAPEHAYDVLLEHPDLDRTGLCNEAQERLRMAATPLPDESGIITGIGPHYEWDETRHEWELVRESGHCVICTRPTWREGDDTREMCCAQCERNTRALMRLLLHELLVPLLTPEEAQAWEAQLPRPRRKPQRGRLRFSDYRVVRTRDLAQEPGPRTYRPRPIVHGPWTAR